MCGDYFMAYCMWLVSSCNGVVFGLRKRLVLAHIRRAFIGHHTIIGCTALSCFCYGRRYRFQGVLGNVWFLVDFAHVCSARVSFYLFIFLLSALTRIPRFLLYTRLVLSLFENK